MTEAEQFAAIDAYEGNTMIAFSDHAIALRYMQHRQTAGFVRSGLFAAAHDSRTGSGLFVLWRDPVPPDELATRQGSCLWLLEEMIAGRWPRPVAGKVQPGGNRTAKRDRE